MVFRYRPIPRSDSGSGVIIDADGHVLTSHHVIRNATRLTVTLWDGSEYDAAVVGTDPENDLAVIRFDPGGTPLTVIPFGDSTDLRVGQKVLAIGNPFGQDRSLTTGIVSGLGPAGGGGRRPHHPADDPGPTPPSTRATPADRCWTPAAS